MRPSKNLENKIQGSFGHTLTLQLECMEVQGSKFCNKLEYYQNQAPLAS